MGRGFAPVALAIERAEPAIDHPRRQEQTLDEHEPIAPERVRLLPEVQPGAKPIESIDRAATRCPSVRQVHRPFPVGLLSHFAPYKRWLVDASDPRTARSFLVPDSVQHARREDCPLPV